MLAPSPACDAVIAAVESALHTANTKSLPQTQLAHLGGCTRCRAGLLLALRALAERTELPVDPDLCTRFRADLPAFVEHERRDSIRAAEHHSVVWTHLLACCFCTEEYVTLHALLDAEQAAALPSSGALASSPPGFARIRLTRPMLIRALPTPQQMRSAYRGSEPHSFVLLDASDGFPPRQLTIVVYEQDEEHWAMKVTAAPPVQGRLLLTAGFRSFTALFTPEGAATIQHIPADLMIDTDAPDLELALLP